MVTTCVMLQLNPNQPVLIAQNTQSKNSESQSQSIPMPHFMWYLLRYADTCWRRCYKCFIIILVNHLTYHSCFYYSGPLKNSSCVIWREGGEDRRRFDYITIMYLQNINLETMIKKLKIKRRECICSSRLNCGVLGGLRALKIPLRWLNIRSNHIEEQQ